jgi:mannitol/fructose-specific phosphotransferase system IIA component (Ntr-type)
VMLVGIPRAMDAEYLRLVGILMRVFRNEKLRHKLLYAPEPADIVRIFEQGESADLDE